MSTTQNKLFQSQRQLQCYVYVGYVGSAGSETGMTDDFYIHKQQYNTLHKK